MNDSDKKHSGFIFDYIFENIDGLLNKYNKSRYAQYYTRSDIASYMASMFKKTNKKVIRILDPGCGIGILTAAYLDKLIKDENNKVSKVIITMYEIDDVVIPRLKKNMDQVRNICRINGLDIKYSIINDNLIRDFYNKRSSSNMEEFDYVIMNPPYMKLFDNSTDNIMLESMGINVSNYYSAFVSIAIKLLVKDGQLVAITPRSFCNGAYFLEFRKNLLESMSFDKIHLFESRKDLFKEDDVLQENIIFHCVKRKAKRIDKINIFHSYSNLYEKLSVEQKRFEDIVFQNDSNYIIRIIREAEEEISNKINSLKCKLEDLGITVSTGPVVDFREPKESQSKDKIFNGIPFIFSEHISMKGIIWPKSNVKKYNYISLNEKNRKRMRKNGNYVLLKRMTSKEEPRRIVSAIYEGDNYNYEYLAFDNKVNYFHINKGGLPITIARGLCIYLNSTIVDRYFRIFSGNTQVNATDLRSLNYPNLDQLKELGEKYEFIIGDQEAVDRTLEEILF